MKLPRSLCKVAVHSYVENLFKSIWGMPHCRAPHAVKYFFDFLDAQADNMKITDPDVLHIWKTNRYAWGIKSSVESVGEKKKRCYCPNLKSAPVFHPDMWFTLLYSLPLRFWINILKNPQFVFDMEKAPHLDGCLSVIAQAFMDSFSLSETQLGKVNKCLMIYYYRKSSFPRLRWSLW